MLCLINLVHSGAGRMLHEPDSHVGRKRADVRKCSDYAQLTTWMINLSDWQWNLNNLHELPESIKEIKNVVWIISLYKVLHKKSLKRQMVNKEKLIFDSYSPTHQILKLWDGRSGRLPP